LLTHRHFRRFLVVASSLIVSGVAYADTAAVKKAVEARFGQPVKSVTESGYLGLYEVFDGRRIFYTDESANVLIDGELYDLKKKSNVTAARLNKLTAIDFDTLPLKQAVKIKLGDGKRVLATFEDPNCIYCKRLAKNLRELKDVSIYTFLIPILGPDSLEKTKKIWCSKDRVGAWNAWMLEAKLPKNQGDCPDAENMVAQAMELAKKYNIKGTPAMFFSNGERLGGLAPAKIIEQRLRELALEKKKSRAER